MKREETLTGDIDWLTLLLYVLLVLVGWFTIYSAVYTDEQKSIFDAQYNSGKQFQWMMICSFLAFVILLIDGRFFSTFAYPLYVAVMLLLFGVLLFGVEINGNKAWIRIGTFQMQPSELAKTATALALAKYLAGLQVSIRLWRHKIVSGLIIGIPMLLTLLQGDAGSAIVFSIFIIVLFREGLESVYPLTVLALIVLGVLSLIIPVYWLIGLLMGIALFIAYFNMRSSKTLRILAIIWILASSYMAVVHQLFERLEPHQKDRINVLLGKGGNDYNIRQSLIAIGSGGLWGKGYLKGTQTKFKFVPEQSTDFIFSSIGEEFGFWGSVLLILLFVLLLLRLVFLAERQRSQFSRVYGYSVVSILFIHFLINLGMAIGVVPVIGIPLPFISYGGSSLLSFTLLLFVFIRLDSNRHQILR